MGLLYGKMLKKNNKVADNESRKLRNNLEWSLETPIFDKIRSIYGPVTIYLFSSQISARVGRYSYTPDLKACGQNAFYFSWQLEDFHAFRPFSCIPQVINQIELESATDILVIPLFTTQPWFILLSREFL